MIKYKQSCDVIPIFGRGGHQSILIQIHIKRWDSDGIGWMTIKAIFSHVA